MAFQVMGVTAGRKTVIQKFIKEALLVCQEMGQRSE